MVLNLEIGDDYRQKFKDLKNPLELVGFKSKIFF